MCQGHIKIMYIMLICLLKQPIVSVTCVNFYQWKYMQLENLEVNLKEGKVL